MRQPSKFGKYQLLERIAVGGMAEVFVAKAFGVEGFERLLAIKKILPTMGEDGEFISMFVDEARIAVQLSHANIVQVLELGKHDDNLYIAMEYISGRDVRQLQERFRKRGAPLPIPQACLIVAEVCEALDYAHRKRDSRGQPLGIVHRDVSPQNVLVSYEGEVKLIDFGIAKAESRLQKTQAGILKGKFSYMSPEQVRGQNIDGRSDVFACGILLWELLCGEKLFTGDSDFAVLEKVRNGVVPAPRTINKAIPEALEKVLAKALHVDVAQRYQTASELHDDLMRFTVVNGLVYGSRQLAEWVREEFQVEYLKEQARLRVWLGAKNVDDEEATPSDPIRKKQVDAFVAARASGGDFAITPQDPFPVAAVQAIVDSQDKPTELHQMAADSTPQELPTMKMDGDELVQAEKAFAARKSAPPPVSLSFDDERTDIEPPAELRKTSQPPPPPPDISNPRHAPTTNFRVPEPTKAAAEDFDVSDEPTGAVRMQRTSAMSRTSSREMKKIAAAKQQSQRRVMLWLGVPFALLVLAGLAFILMPSDVARPGKVIVTPSPSIAAELLIDGKPSGQLPPFVHTVAAGVHKLEVRADGYRPFSTTVTVPSGGRPVEVDAQLQSDGPMQVEGVVLNQPKPVEPAPAPEEPKKKHFWTKPAKTVAAAKPVEAPKPPEVAARLKIVTEPAGAEISVDGKPVGKSPLTVGPLSIGPMHPVIATLDGYAPAKRVTKVDDQSLTELTLTLSQAEPQVAEAAPVPPTGVGYLTAATKPTARLTIDGRDTGRWTPVPPANPIALPAGDHTVIFETADGRKLEESVTVEAGKTARLIRSVP